MGRVPGQLGLLPGDPLGLLGSHFYVLLEYGELTIEGRHVDLVLRCHAKIDDVADASPQELIARGAGQTTIVLGGAGEAGLREVERMGIPATMGNGDVLVRVADPGQMRATLARLAAIQAPIRDMYTKRGTLEDVFLSLVGARMDEGVLQG